MIKILSKFCLLILLAGIATSCNFKDKGNLVLTPLPDIVIDTTGIPLSRNVAKDSTLIIAPKVSKEGYTDDDFTYQWIMTNKPGADFVSSRVISTAKVLSEPIDANPSTDYYSLWYKVTDKKNGLQSGVVFRVVVQPPTKQGLVVADSDDGVYSDLSVVQDSLFTTDWKDPLTNQFKPTYVLRNEFSRVNNSKIQGVLHSLFAQRLYYNGLNTNFLHGAARNNAFRLATLDYSVVAEGADLFYDASVNMDIDYYFLNGATNAWIINNGKVANRLTESATLVGIRKFSIDVPGNYTANRAIAVHPTINQSAIYYDESLGKFLRFGTSLNVKAAPLESTSGSTPFNPTNLPGYTVLGGGLGNDLTEARFVMKKDDYYGVFCLTYAAAARRQIDISDAPEIEDAIAFVFPSNQAVIYYATADKLYSILIPQGGNPSYQLLYTSPETITGLEMLRKSGSLDVTYTEQCLLVITYNGSEGKITALPIPFEGLGSGSIDVSRKATFGGFKKISAVAIQE